MTDAECAERILNRFARELTHEFLYKGNDAANSVAEKTAWQYLKTISQEDVSKESK